MRHPQLLWLPVAIAACTHVDAKPIVDVAHAVCPPSDTFAHAICVCGDLDDVGELHVRPGPAGAGSVGVDGETTLVSDADIAGSLYAWGGFNSVGGSVGDTLVTPGDAVITGDATLHDATIGGDLVATGSVTIDRLGLGGSTIITGDSAIGTHVPYVAPAGPPCGCDGASFFDVANAVAAARQATDGQPSWDYVGTADHHLPTGSYYVTSAEIVGDARFVIDGKVSVFVDGSLDSVGSSKWELSAGATLDLFVSGNVAWVGDMTAGDPANASALRIWVGGSDTTTIDSVGTTELAASLYAPRADIDYIGDAHVIGSIFAHSINGVGALTIDYGTPPTLPQSCTQPPGSVSPPPNATSGATTSRGGGIQ